MHARDLHGDSYAAMYRALYIDHPQSRDKHACNVAIVRPPISRRSS